MRINFLKKIYVLFKNKSSFGFRGNVGKTRDFQKGRLEHKLKGILSLSSPELS
jgi:hypothetical protein